MVLVSKCSSTTATGPIMGSWSDTDLQIDEGYDSPIIIDIQCITTSLLFFCSPSIYGF
jgi:hypothetical protein